MNRFAATALALTATLALAACVTIQPARMRSAEDRVIVEVQPVDPADWPERLRTESGELGVIQEERSAWLSPGRLPPGGFLEPGEHHADDAKALARAAGLDEAARFEFEGPGSFVFTPIDRRRDLAAGEPQSIFRFVSATPTSTGDYEIQRTWFSFFPARTETTRALAVLQPGMLGTPAGLVDDLAGRLTADGYAVLRMMAHPSRFTEFTTLTVTRDMEGSAQEIARVLENRVAEAAYAVEAATEFVRTIDPKLRTVPRIAIGMSGGAMILTTVMARAADDWAAGIAIAGGTNFWEIHERSNYAYFINAFDQRWQELTPTEENRELFARVYLEHAPIDSYHTARAVAQHPFLLIHGSADRAVPAHLGDELWTRLGRPERWTSPVGHELLFFFLQGQFDEMLIWLDQHVPGGHRNENADV